MLMARVKGDLRQSQQSANHSLVNSFIYGSPRLNCVLGIALLYGVARRFGVD